MGALRDYYVADSRDCFRLTREVELGHQDKGGRLKVSVGLMNNLEANAKYAAIYIPATNLFDSPVRVAMHHFDEAFDELNRSVEILMGTDDGEPPLSSKTLVFTNRLYIYSENEISSEDREHITQVSRNRGWDIKFRLPSYAAARSKWEKPVAFISHDSRDKAELAEPLALELIKIRHSVWFDEFSLTVGDSLRESIEKGLKECEKCIFLITPNFLENEGWAKREYDSIFTRELIEEKKVILPVWKGVSKQEVYEYSPVLADKFACVWDDDISKVVRALNKALK